MITKNNRFYSLLKLYYLNALTVALTVFFNIYIGNNLGPENYGLLSYCLVISSGLCLLVNFEVSSTIAILTKTLSKFNNLYSKFFFFKLFNYILITIIVIFLNIEIIFKIGIIILILPSINFNWLFEYKNQNVYFGKILLIEKLLLVISSVVFIDLIKLNLGVYFVLYLFVNLLSIIYQYKHYKIKISIPSLNFHRLIYHSNIFLCLTNIIYFFYGAMSKLIFEYKYDLYTFGIFTMGMSIINLISVFQSQVEKVYRITLINSMLKNERNKLQSILKEYIKYTTLPVLVISFIFFFTNELFIKLILSDEYKNLINYWKYFTPFFLIINIKSLLNILWLGVKRNSIYFSINTAFVLLTGILLFLSPTGLEVKYFVSIISICQILNIITLYAFYKVLY